MKTKIDKWDCIERKMFSTAKEMISKMKRQTKEFGKIFTNHASDIWGLISKTCKELKQFNK